MPAVSDVEADNVLLRLLLTPEGRADPYPLYRQLRETVPVLRSSVGPIVVSRHEDCLTALRNPHLGRGTALRASGEGPSLGFAGFDVDPEQRQEFFERAGTTCSSPTRPTTRDCAASSAGPSPLIGSRVYDQRSKRWSVATSTTCSMPGRSM